MRGRPKKEIDETLFKKLCEYQCTLSEIAGIFDCSEDTIERWCKRIFETNFAETFKKYSAPGKMSLRRIQFKLAEKSAAMAIFLGKNYLGQTDNVVVQNQEQASAIEQIAKALINNNGSDIG